MNLLRFKIDESIYSIRSDKILHIIGQNDLIGIKTKNKDIISESDKLYIKIINLKKIFNHSNKTKKNSRIIFIKGIPNPYGIIVDEILNIGEGIAQKPRTLISLKKGIDPKLIDGFEILDEGVSIILNCDLIVNYNLHNN